MKKKTSHFEFWRIKNKFLLRKKINKCVGFNTKLKKKIFFKSHKFSFTVIRVNRLHGMRLWPNFGRNHGHRSNDVY